MTRTHHYEFAHIALREMFFANPNGVLAAFTDKGERPAVELWNSVGKAVEGQGEELLASTGLATTLVTFASDRACALITLPRPTEELEAYFVALVSTPRAFRYVTLEKPAAPDSDSRFGLLCEWTEEGEHINPRIPVPVGLSDFIREVRLYVA